MKRGSLWRRSRSITLISLSALKLSSLLAFVWVASLCATFAETLQYTFSGQGDGFFNGRQFSYTTVTISATANTNQVLNYGNGLFVLLIPQGADIFVAGVGAGRFRTTNAIFYSNHNTITGLKGFDSAGTEAYIAEIGLLGSPPRCDLSAPIGPLYGYNFISGTAHIQQHRGLLLCMIGSQV